MNVPSTTGARSTAQTQSVVIKAAMNAPPATCSQETIFRWMPSPSGLRLTSEHLAISDEVPAQPARARSTMPTLEPVLRLQAMQIWAVAVAMPLSEAAERQRRSSAALSLLSDGSLPGQCPLLGAPALALLYRLLTHLNVLQHQAGGGQRRAGEQQSSGAKKGGDLHLWISLKLHPGSRCEKSASRRYPPCFGSRPSMFHLSCRAEGGQGQELRRDQPTGELASNGAAMSPATAPATRRVVLRSEHVEPERRAHVALAMRRLRGLSARFIAGARGGGFNSRSAACRHSGSNCAAVLPGLLQRNSRSLPLQRFRPFRSGSCARPKNRAASC